MSTSTQGPAVTPEGREYARTHPGTWLYMVDPAFPGTDDVPPWGVVGSYRVDEDGEIREAFTPNPDYRPTPYALGFPPPGNRLEAALQDAVTGHGGDDAVRAALVDGAVFVPHAPDGPGLLVRDEGLDREVVHAFTSDRYLPGPATWRYWTHVPVGELAPLLGERYLVLNPGSDLELRLPGEDLA